MGMDQQEGPLNSEPTKELAPERFRMDFPLSPQPDDTSCGPTCLHALYAFYGDKVPLDRLIQDIPPLKNGGTLAVQLGTHAVRRGYRARLWTFNLRIFDPTWFGSKKEGDQLASRLSFQATHRTDPKTRLAAEAYLEFVRLGGTIEFEVLTGRLIRGLLRRRCPVLAGLSSTFLYNTCREMPDTNEDDPLRGDPCGHFVILSGYDQHTRLVQIADPYEENPMGSERHYEVATDRLLNAILLGVLTYDGNLLMIEPKTKF